MAERPSNIETLPEVALDDVQWLHDAIRARRHTQGSMAEIFNGRLAAKGIGPISYSALNRYVLKVRDGRIPRPRSFAASTHAPTSVLAEPFRTSLLASIGEVALTQIELALTALVKK